MIFYDPVSQISDCLITFGIANSFVVIAQSKALNTLGSLSILYEFLSP